VSGEIWGKIELRKEYEECDLNHALDEYSTNININRRKILLMRKKMESRENDYSRMSNLLSLGCDNSPKVELCSIYSN